MVEAWKGGRSVRESSAVDAAVVQRTPVLSIRLISISTPRAEWKWSSLMLCFHVTVDADGSSR